MDLQEAKKRLLAAQTLLLEPSSSFEKFASVKTLIAGVHPGLDEVLERAGRELDTIEQILGHDYILFASQNLPERTEEQKKRKNAVLLFWRTWNTLRGEVARVQAEMNSANASNDQVVKSGHIARIFNFAKGPFAVVTVIAVALVAAGTYSAKSSVQITIQNHGCPTMLPSTSMPQFIPGVSFPTKPIPNGATGEVSLPGIPITIDGSQKGKLLVSSLVFHMTFEMGAITDATFDNEELIQRITEIQLSKSPTHFLDLICK